MKTIFIVIILSLYYTIISSSIHYTLEEDKIYILIGSETFLINLFESPITKELISLLPLKTKLLEENDSEKILPLSVKIETETFFLSEKFSNNGKIGDLFLYKGKNLVFITETKTFEENNGDYIKMGYTKEIGEIINLMEKNKNKTFLLWNTLNYAEYKGKIKPYAYYSSLMNYSWKILTFFCFLFL